MPFTVVEEPAEYFDNLWVLERCCFCRIPTKFWYVKKDVACCQGCAKKHQVKYIPTKKQWCDNDAGITSR